MSVFIQEGCALNRDLVQLTGPRPIGQRAWEGTFLAGEIIEPGASILSSWPLCLVQTVWVVATLFIRPNLASMKTVVAPFQIAK